MTLDQAREALERMEQDWQFVAGPFDWRDVHESYGPCDAFGPRDACSMCVGIIQRDDGSTVSEWDGRVLQQAERP